LSFVASAPVDVPLCALTHLFFLFSTPAIPTPTVNPNTLATTDVIGDTGLKTLRENDVIQLERRGYYRVDRPYVAPDKPLILFTIPDGKAKAMSGQTGKLAHR